MHIRRKIVNDFASYLDEMEDNELKIPKSVRSFVSQRQDVEKAFDDAFKEVK